MTAGPSMDWVMQAVLANVELKGTTMGSRKEFRDMVAFVNEKKIRPVVSRVVQGLDNLEGIDGLFKDMQAGKQFGKLVIGSILGTSLHQNSRNHLWDMQSRHIWKDCM